MVIGLLAADGTLGLAEADIPLCIEPATELVPVPALGPELEPAPTPIACAHNK